MGRRKLDPDLLNKMVRKARKSKQYLREQVSRLASRHAVSSLAAQLLWAREMGLGITGALNRAGAAVGEEIRSSPRASARGFATTALKNSPRTRPRRDPNLAAAIGFVLEDPELRDRCRDLILAPRHYDRVVREATTVLDSRLKKLTGISHMNPGDIVGKVLAPDPARAVITISAEKDLQEGFFSICKGVMQAFRNRAHHNLSNTFTQADALRFCGFVDTILAVVGKGQVHLERV